jgi:PPOX class probable F420-dependent enzyme
MGVRIDEEEAWARVAASHTAILATLRKDGSPTAIPMWFAIVDGAICMRTAAASAKVGHVRRDPRVTVLVEAGEQWIELRAVIVRGTATLVDDPAEKERIDAAVDAKYADHAPPDDLPAGAKAYLQTERAHLRIVPDGPLVTWDNRRIRRSG